MFSILPEFLNRDNSANVAQPNNYKGRAGGTATLSLADVMQTVWGERATVRLPESATQNKKKNLKRPNIKVYKTISNKISLFSYFPRVPCIKYYI